MAVSHPPVLTQTGPTPYTGPWGRSEASHLLRRATYAPLAAEIDRAVDLGLAASLELLLTPAPPPPSPVFFDYAEHPAAGIGDAWEGLYANPADRSGDNNARNRSLTAWWFLNQSGGMNVSERMTFFWWNHFGMVSPADARTMLRDLRTMQAAATGDVRQLVKDITVSVSMLRFLNGNQSTAGNPVENFARELIELFTLGVGTDDSPNYTEADVRALARSLTGWRTRNINSSEPGVESEAYFQANRHDTGVKQLSHHFGNARIVDEGSEEYKTVVNIIFEQEEVSRFLCRKLYRYFVYYEIDATVEAEVIEPLAAILRANDYVVGPVLRALFGSAHFYQATFRGALIKSPLEAVHAVMRPLGYYFDQTSAVDNYFAAHRGSRQARDMGLELLRPPGVKGWEAFYQSPAYYRLWLNTATLQTRNNFYRIALRNNGFTWNGAAHPFDYIAYIDAFPDPFDPYTLIERMAEDVLPAPLAPGQLQDLRDLLLPDIDDFVWAGELADLRSNPNDQALRTSVNRRLKAMVAGLFQLAEFQVF